MTRYRLSCTIDDMELSSVIGAISTAALLSELDPEITLSLMASFTAQPNEALASTAQAEAIAKRVVKRATKGNGDWPAPGSIYGIVLQAIQSEPKTNAVLSEILKNNGKSPDSLGSATARLKKANRAKFGEGGWIAI